MKEIRLQGFRVGIMAHLIHSVADCHTNQSKSYVIWGGKTRPEEFDGDLVDIGIGAQSLGLCQPGIHAIIVLCAFQQSRP